MMLFLDAPHVFSWSTAAGVVMPLAERAPQCLYPGVTASLAGHYPDGAEGGRDARPRGTAQTRRTHMTKVVTALVVLSLVASGRAFAANENSRITTTTTTERKADGDGVKTTIDTKWKTDGAAGETTHDERLTMEKHVKPDGNAETTKHVKTSHKSPASRRAHKTDVEEKTVRGAQGNVISYEKKVK
jgi:hypothetical protein